jgi:hypothetical protein
MKHDMLEMGTAQTNRYLPKCHVADSVSITNTTSSFLVIHGRYGWVFDAAKKLQALSVLPKGWDSYGGLPLRPEAREMAARVLDELQARPMPVPNVALGSEGNVHLEWRSTGRELEVELGDGTSIEYLKVGPDGDIVEEGKTDFLDSQRLENLAGWLVRG